MQYLQSREKKKQTAPNRQKGKIMEKLSSVFGAIVATIGGIIGWIWGDFTPLLAALIVCMVLDYISGVACAIVRKDVSSEVGFKGIVKKILILMLVGVAHVLDAYVLNSTPVLQSAVTMFFIANEGISLVENAAGLGIPIPKKMLEVLKQLKLKGDSNEESENDEGENPFDEYADEEDEEKAENDNIFVKAFENFLKEEQNKIQ